MKTCCSTTGENPQHRDFFVKTQSLQYRDKVSHTEELWKFSKSPYTTPEIPHTGKLWKFQSPTHHRVHTPGNFENFQSLYTPQTMDPTHTHTGEVQSPYAPQHRAHTPGNFENFQSTYTPHRAEPTHRGTLKIETLKIFKVPTHQNISGRFLNSPHTTV